MYGNSLLFLKVTLIVIVVYGISWIFLLLDFLYFKLTKNSGFFFESEEYDDEIEKINNIKDESYYFALFVTAPIIICSIPYLLIKFAKYNRKFEKIQIQYTEKRRALEKKRIEGIENMQEHGAKKKKAIKNYEESTPQPFPSECIIKGQRLTNVVINLDYEKILWYLNNLHLPNKYKLDVKFEKIKDYGSRSILCVRTPLGETCDVFNTIMVEDTPIGAIEVYLLYEVWHYMRLGWQENYAYREYIYTTEDLRRISNYTSVKEIRKLDISPIVTQNNGKYYVSCCFWSDYEGVIRELVEIEIKENKVVNILEVNSTTLYEDSCIRLIHRENGNFH